MGIARNQQDFSRFIKTQPESIGTHSTFYVHVVNPIINCPQSHHFTGAINHPPIVGVWQPGFPTLIFFRAGSVIPQCSHGRFWTIFGPACSRRKNSKSSRHSMPQPVTRLCWWLSGINHGKKRSVSGFLGPKRQNVPSEGSLIAPFFMQHFLAHDMIASAKYSTTPLKPGFIFFVLDLFIFAFQI